MSQKFRALGKHYGYPDCCVDAFVQRVEKGINDWKDHLTQRQIEISDMNTGFIPCATCCDKIYDEDVSLKTLIKDREHPYPFPINDFSIAEKMLKDKGIEV